jgi:NADH-quinone oxidoreductase subunit G
LRALGAALQAPGFEFVDLQGLRESMSHRAWQGAAAAGANHGAGPGNGLEVASAPAIYRGDAVLRRAAALQAHPLTAGARLRLNDADAQAAGVADGAMAKVSVAQGHAMLPVSVDAGVARGCAWLESGYGAVAPLLAAGRVEVSAA